MPEPTKLTFLRRRFASDNLCRKNLILRAIHQCRLCSLGAKIVFQRTSSAARGLLPFPGPESIHKQIIQDSFEYFFQNFKVMYLEKMLHLSKCKLGIEASQCPALSVSGQTVWLGNFPNGR